MTMTHISTDFAAAALSNEQVVTLCVFISKSMKLLDEIWYIENWASSIAQWATMAEYDWLWYWIDKWSLLIMRQRGMNGRKKSSDKYTDAVMAIIKSNDCLCRKIMKVQFINDDHSVIEWLLSRFCCGLLYAMAIIGMQNAYLNWIAKMSKRLNYVWLNANMPLNSSFKINKNIKQRYTHEVGCSTWRFLYGSYSSFSDWTAFGRFSANSMV